MKTPLTDQAYSTHPVLDTQTGRDAILKTEAEAIERRLTPTFNLPPFFFVFDVESIGLHGPAFAVAYVVVSPDGAQHEANCFAVTHEEAMGQISSGYEDDLAWVREHVPFIQTTSNVHDSLRVRFWLAWMNWKAQGAVMVADCAWPVEARFLAWCIDFDVQARKWEGPYPLHDLASIRLSRGLDPLGVDERKKGEFPLHHPLADAKKSARLLLEAITP